MHFSSQDSKNAYLRAQQIIEALVYVIILASPWAFGCTDPQFEFYLTCAASAVLLVFSVCLLTIGIPSWNAGKTGLLVLASTIGLVLVTLIQLVPLPSGLVSLLAPGVSEWSGWAVDLSVSDEPSMGSSAVGSSGDGWFVGNALGLYQSLGLYRGGSFQMLVRLLMISGLFGVVCCLQRPRDVLRRLSWVAAAVGTALAIFGIAQHFGSRDGLVYWTIPVEGGLGFGPFINRNHYPFFLNLTLGLTLGLLVERLESMGKYWSRMLFGDPTVGWLLVAVIFMVASLITCVSRGGLISALVAITAVSLFRMQAKNASRTLLMGVLIALPVMIVLTWVGFSFQESRLTLLTEADSYTSDGRWQLWRAALQSVPDFPWFGSGAETYQHWETIYQTGNPNWNNWKSLSLRADNEFLDVLNEYGVAGLLALLVGVVAIARAAIIGCRHSPMAAGASMGMLAVLMHSFVDFGLRVPSTAVLATVITGLLCSVTSTGSRRSSGSSRSESSHRRSSLGSAKRESNRDGNGEDGNGSDRRRRSASQQTAGSGTATVRVQAIAIAAGVALVLISLLAIRTKRRYAAADQFRVAAYDDVTRRRPKTAVEKMSMAVQITPEDLPLRLDAIRVMQIALQEFRSRDGDKNQTAADRVLPLIVEHSTDAARLCPIAWQPPAWLAQYGADAVERRLELLMTSRRLHPSEPDLAFLTGELVADASSLQDAFPHWKDSLRYSTEHLSQIASAVDSSLDSVNPDLKTNDDALAKLWIEELLPEDPVVTLAAAVAIQKMSPETDADIKTESTTPDTQASESSQVPELLLERVLDLIDHPETSRRQMSVGDAEALRARALVQLDRLEDATTAMRLAINQNPDNIRWRLEMAKLLMETGRLNEAVTEVRIVFNFDRDNRQAKSLQKEISKRKAKTLTP